MGSFPLEYSVQMFFEVDLHGTVFEYLHVGEEIEGATSEPGDSAMNRSRVGFFHLAPIRPAIAGVLHIVH